LPGGNRSRAENSCGYYCQKRVFDFLAHGSSPFKKRAADAEGIRYQAIFSVV
jgi:hypothetical protein